MKFKLVKISSKGQVVIPQDIREKFKIREGDYLVFIPLAEDLMLIKKVVLDEKNYKPFIKMLHEAFNEIGIEISEEQIERAFKLILSRYKNE